MFGTTWVYNSTFSIVNFMKSKYRSNISNENISSELSCTVSIKQPPDFKDFIKYIKNIKYLNNFYIDQMLE